MSRRRQPSTDYDIDGGRRAFMTNSAENENPWTEAEAAAELIRQQSAMCSFTESVDDDLPPAPKLPPSLDIDYQYPNTALESDISNTIGEMTKKFNEDVRQADYDKSLGATQKYPLVVSGPGKVDAEQELHESLLEKTSDSSLDSDMETQQLHKDEQRKKTRHKNNNIHDELVQKCSVSALQRPRPTTPTSWCAIENYVEGCSASTSTPTKASSDSGPKMRVVIPSKDQPQSVQRRRKSSMSWSDFYESMASQMPPQARSASLSGRSTPAGQYEDDILEKDPSYRDIAPPKPVVHRRSSTEWENFEGMIIDSTSSQHKVSLVTTNGEAEQHKGELSIVDKTGAETSNENQNQSQTPEQWNDEPPSQQIQQIEAFPSSFDNFDNSHDFSTKDNSQLPMDNYTVAKDADKQNNQDSLTENVKTAATMDGDKFETHIPMEQYANNSSDRQVFSTYMQTSGTQNESVIPENPFQWSRTGAEERLDFNQKAPTGYTASDAVTGNSSFNPFTQAWEDDDPGFSTYQPTAEIQPPEPQSIYEYNQQQNSHADNQMTLEQDYFISDGQKQFYPPVPDSSASSYRYSIESQHSKDNQYSFRGQQEQSDHGYSSAGYDYATPDTTFQQNINERLEVNDYSTDDQPQPSYNNEGSQAIRTTYDSAQQEVESFTDPTPSFVSTYTNYSQSSAAVPPEPIPFVTEYRPPEIIKPRFMKPLLPEFKPAPVDPFSWEAQEATTSTHPIPYQAAPLYPPAPNFSHDDHLKQEAAESTLEPSEEKKTKKPPPRPAPPSATGRAAPPARPKVPPSPRPPRKEIEPEVDAWTQFKQISEKASEAVKVTEDKLKALSETTVANEVKDESYIAQVGGTQTFVPELAQRQIKAKEEELAFKKAEKKKQKKSHKGSIPEVSPLDEEKMDRAAEELVKKMAATRMDLGDWKPPSERDAVIEKAMQKDVVVTSQPLEKELSSKNLKETPFNKQPDAEDHTVQTAIDHVGRNRWTAFDGQTAPHLPPSDSDFFATAATPKTDDAFGAVDEAFSPLSTKDPFAPPEENLIQQDYDPFEIKPAEDVLEAAKARAAAESAAAEAQQDLEFFGGVMEPQGSSASTPTQEGGSPASSRPAGFDDEFHVDVDAENVMSPLYDEDDAEPLADFPSKFTGEGWELMVRYPIKKRLMGDRFWKPCFVKLQGCTLYLCESKKDQKPFQEMLLQTSYSVSDTTLQAYDIYGKIHTVKLQYVVYKERVGIRPGQISRLVEGHITKYGLPLEHAAQCTVLLKFGCLNAAELTSFVTTVEDVLFRCPARREVTPVYKQDEVQIHCYDEYAADVDKDGVVSNQRARVRLFCLAFLTGSPYIEIGLNDRRRQGKEIVRRKDILPMYTERWIRVENIEFHNTVNKKQFDEEQVISFQPPDGCFFEVMRFRIRPPRNREKPLSVKSVMRIAGSKIEIRIEAMAAPQIQKTKGGRVTKNQIPCEDIQIRFPIPEAWIYLFREERNWGVGSVHARIRRPGKVKNLKDRLMGVVQNLENSLIEVAIGEAKYEHIYRSLVWRIPRLPERHHEAYKQHLLKCRFELSSFDLMPETFIPTCDVEFTMPLATISNAVVRSVSVEQHEDSDRVEKFVRYVAKCTYKVEVDYVQCSTLDVDAIVDPMNVNPEASLEIIPEPHKPAFHPDETKDTYAGYRIDLPEEHIDVRKKDEDSSSEDGESEKKTPMIQIDMRGYGY